MMQSMQGLRGSGRGSLEGGHSTALFRRRVSMASSTILGVGSGASGCLPAIWKQEMVPRAKDYEQCQIKVTRKGLAERGFGAKVSTMLGL